MSKILVIEDEEIVRKSLAAGLSAEGNTVLEASDGNEAIKVALDQKPDLILTDMSLPKMTGWELIDALRSDPETKSIPIIALSAHTTSEDRDKAFEAGANAYETKPADVSRLKLRIAELLDA